MKTITIKTGVDQDLWGPVQVEAHPVGEYLAINRPYEVFSSEPSKAKTWNVTHIPTGYACGNGFTTIAEARLFARVFARTAGETLLKETNPRKAARVLNPAYRAAWKAVLGGRDGNERIH